MKPLAGRFALVSLALACACSIQEKKIDYKSEAQQARPLEVPPRFLEAPGFG